jgi:hypothetical protein
MYTRKRAHDAKSNGNEKRKKTENGKEKDKPISNWKAQKHSKEPQNNIGGEKGKEKVHAQVALLVVDVINDLQFEGMFREHLTN